jgi:disulfide bond formation protein DsbB
MLTEYRKLAFAENNPIMIAGAISATLLVVALLFEHVGGLVPCELCLTQRVPHYGIVGLTIISLMSPSQQKTWRPVGALLAATTAGIGMQHVGVEQGWWQGPQGCSANIGADASLADLTTSLLATPVVRCDEVAWSLFSISMAGWNMLISTALAIFLISATLKIMKSQN